MLDYFQCFFSQTYTLMFQTQRCHWNVRGKDFFALHEFFKECYTFLFEAIDTMAERMRTLDGFTPMTLTAMDEITHAHSPWHALENNCDARKMVEIFLENTHILLTQGKALCIIAGEQNDVVTQDLVIGFLEKIELLQWQARSYLHQ